MQPLKRFEFCLWLGMVVSMVYLPAVGLAEEVAKTLSEVETSPGTNTTQLWNGQNLTGWRTFFTNEVDVATLWSATNGVLHLVGKPMGYLRTEEVFSNCQVHVEWRWPTMVSNSNSGVFVFMNGPEAIWPVSVECQLKNGSAGELVGQGGVDFTAPLIKGKKRAKISKSSEHAMGEWNAYDIYCRSNTIETFVNGVRQVFVDKVTVSSGNVGLQLEGFPVEFRNMWVR